MVSINDLMPQTICRKCCVIRICQCRLRRHAGPPQISLDPVFRLKQIVPLPDFTVHPRLPQLAPATPEGLIATAVKGHANGPQMNHSDSVDQEKRNPCREPGNPEAGCVHRSSLPPAGQGSRRAENSQPKLPPSHMMIHSWPEHGGFAKIRSVRYLKELASIIKHPQTPAT